MPDTLSTAQSVSTYPPTDIAKTAQPPASDDDDLLPTKGKIRQAQQFDIDITKQAIGAEDRAAAQMNKQDRENRARMDRMFAAQGATMDDLKPWNAQQEMASRQTSLWDSFGSPGFVIAMVASAFSAQPMNAALNSGAAAINAIKQGDMESYNKAFEAWKQNTDLTLKRLDQERQMYDEASNLRGSDLNAWRAKITTIAAMFNDKRKLGLLQAGMDGNLIQAIEAQTTAAKNLADAKNAIELNHLKLLYAQSQPGWGKDPGRTLQILQQADNFAKPPAAQAYDQFQNDFWAKNNRPPTFKESTDAIKQIAEAQFPNRAQGGVWTLGREEAAAIAQRAAELRKQGMPEDQALMQAAQEVKPAFAPPATGNAILKEKGLIDQYNMAIDDIIPQIEDTLNKYAGAAGIAGRATRLSERIGDILGGNQTDRVQMMRDIELLQAMAPQMLLNRTTGRPLSSEAERINEIIGGLNLGDTTANTLRSLDELKRRLTKFRDTDRKNIGAPAGALPAQAQPAENDAGWSQFPSTRLQ